jgi:citrate synthase
MVNTRLSTAETARRLGVKPETVYAYVSRGLLTRERTASGSTFDPQEIAQLAHRARHAPADGAPPGGPVFVTEVAKIQEGRLCYRGLDAVTLSRSRSFEEVATWVWTGRWPTERERPWRATRPALNSVRAVLKCFGNESLPVERWMVAVPTAALVDDLRHDLAPAAVPIVGRRLIATLVDTLPMVGIRSEGGRSVSERLWPRLSPLPLTPGRRQVIEAALVLSADHELAASTLAARVAAALRADPYAVVSTGLGPASGNWYPGSTGAPGEVERLLAEAERSDPERAVGDRLRQSGSPVHGFGMPLYPAGDPRGRELLARLREVGGDPARHLLVERIMRIGRDRGFPAPNVDLGLGALSFCAEMIPGAGQAIATLGKVAGWLAHAMEEYAEPTRFRARAAYVGPESVR